MTPAMLTPSPTPPNGGHKKEATQKWVASFLPYFNQECQYPCTRPHLPHYSEDDNGVGVGR